MEMNEERNGELPMDFDHDHIEHCNTETEEEVDNLIRDIFGEDGEHADIVEDDVEIDELPNAESDIDSNIWSNIQNDSEEYQHLKERKFVVGEKAILDLLKRSSCKECKEPVDPSSITEGEKIASGIKFKFVCKNGHEGKWISTPFYGARSVVNMMLQLMVLLSGMSWENFAMGASFINLIIGSGRHFYVMQHQYSTAIKSYFLSHIDKARQSLGGIPLSIAVDVRYNSPGFSANKSTAVFMDSKTHTILHLEIGDSREVDRHSPRMEKILVEKGLKYLVHHSPLVIWEVISDASRTITALMKTDPFKHLKHSLDVWHKSKKLASSLAELARKSAFKVLLYWIKPIVNHFWWCCNTCNGKVDRLLKRWVGILHHVNNNHVLPGGRCFHPETANMVENHWLERDSAAFKELTKIVTNKEWCGSMEYYVNCQQTWAIEIFFSHTLLHYCPKRNSYSYDSYCIRNVLAVLDHNHHKDREAATTMDGIVSAQCQVSRRTKQWVAYERKKEKNFPYIAG
eukprot:XP_019920075.1 PREDICTED: uncharacterized protein LOC105321369 [Crassostrea gigas]